MKDLLFEYAGDAALQQKPKEELIKMVQELQVRDKDWFEKYTDLYKSTRERDKKHEETLSKYQKRIDEYMQKYVVAEVMNEEYRRVVDLKLGKSYNINATWIDKIVFVLKAAGRPLRSSEIIEILSKNDVTFRTLTDKQKGLSAHLTKALKYGRVIGQKQKGQNGYLFSLPVAPESPRNLPE